MSFSGVGARTIAVGVGPGLACATWIDADVTASVLVGLTYEARWWLRDANALGGVAKSEWIRLTIEPR